MSPPGPWTLCYTPPGGVRNCFAILEVDEPPDLTDHPDPLILNQIGRLQALASEVKEARLKMELTLTLDAAVARVSPQLPDGFEFRREATRDQPDGMVPSVVGMDGPTGFATLYNDGYVVKVKARQTGPDTDGIIIDQDPGAGTWYSPSETVTIWEGYVPVVITIPTKITEPE